VNRESWSHIQDVLENAVPAGSDTGTTLSNTLRKLLSVTRSAKTVQKTLATIATLSPHSMQLERMVRHHNTIVQVRRSCMVEETVNTPLLVAINGEREYFKENCKVLLSHLFPEDIGTFAEEMCESWSQIKDVLENALPAGGSFQTQLSATRSEKRSRRQ